jgi:MSHA pilin protein MshD
VKPVSPREPRWLSHPRQRTRGFALVDVLLVIVLLGIAAAALSTASARLASQSAHTLKSRQALAFAQGLLEEVRHMPFTYCDPPKTAANAAACGAQIDLMGPEPGETRYNPANRFDGVSDYQGFTLPGPGCAAGLCDMNGTLLNGPGSSLNGCTAAVALYTQALPGIAALDANGRPQVLRILVTVRCPGIEALVAEGLRVRHAPNAF